MSCLRNVCTVTTRSCLRSPSNCMSPSFQCLKQRHYFDIKQTRSISYSRISLKPMKNRKANLFAAASTRTTASATTDKAPEASKTKESEDFPTELEKKMAKEESQISDLSKILKPILPNDTYVSCSIFDVHGNVTAVSQKFPKTKFLQENGLYPRDLRKIDTSAIDIMPTIAVRGNCILVNLLHIKAIVKSDLIMIFDTAASENAHRLSLFMYDLEAKLKTHSLHSSTYEFRALESILVNVMTCLETDLQMHLTSCGTMLEELEDQIDRDKLRELLIKSKALSSFYQKASLIRDVLDELLDSDDDLEMMYLSERKAKPDYVRTNFDEIEMILESYFKQCDEIVQQAESLINDIRSTDEIVNIILDANRNSLMLFELKITIYTLGFTVMTALPAFYGMNLKNYIEESNYGFGGIIAVSGFLALVVSWANFRKLRSVQRITMMLHGPETRLSPVSSSTNSSPVSPATQKANLIYTAQAAKSNAAMDHPGSNGSSANKSHNHLYTGIHGDTRAKLWKRRNWLKMNFLNKRKGIQDPRNRDLIWKWLADGKK